MRGYLAILIKMKMGKPHDPGTLFLGIRAKETLTYVQKAIPWNIILEQWKV